ncbi:MAG TPA: hypothetical protein VMX57_05970, partial [Planctomycetota bacterium]|nr:hypothetical protein [Planctomycetota bacterium]
VAAGWDGDRLVSFERPTGETVVFWISTWDTPKDAEEMHAALEKWVTYWCANDTDKDTHREAELVRPWRRGEGGVDVICVLTVSRGAAAATATVPVYRKVNVSTTAELTPRDVTR